MSKRGGIFDQGRPEQPYDERSEPAEVPQRATAAQLATRKIKTAKARRPAGASSASSLSANFGAPQQSGFNFGASAPDPSNTGGNNFSFGANSAFGSSATNSFPPVQSSAPSNTFTSASFPAFGASSNQAAAFNPQPPSTSFNFTAGNSNPFASQNSAPTMNGTASTPAFGGFGAQPASNPFGGLGQTATTSGASGGIFGTSGASQTSMFGTANSSAPNATSTPTPASQPFTFGSTSTSAQNSASTPATTNSFSGFGSSIQAPAPAPAQNSLFSGFGANTQKNEGSAETATPKNNLFGGFGTSAQGAENTTATAPATSLFNFGSTVQKKDTAPAATPSTNFFGASGSPAQSTSTATAAPPSNPFAKLPSAANTSLSSSSSSLFNATSQTPQAQVQTPSTSNNIFTSHKPAETPKPNLFASLAKPNSTPAAVPASETPGSNMFGSAQNKNAVSGGVEKATDVATLKAPEAAKSSLFNGFSTPQPAKTTNSEKPLGGLFSAAQPKTSSGIFSQTFQPEKHNSSNLFKAQSAFSFTPPVSSSNEAKSATPQQAVPKETSNPFSNLSTPSAERPNLFSAAKASAPTPSESPMPTLTGAASPLVEASKGSELPKVPKVHVPKEWAVPNIPGHSAIDNIYEHILDLTAQLQALNERYRQQLISLPLTADWSSVSLWHYQHTIDIKGKIDSAKKQRATARGVTGNESTLSTKRKVNNRSPEDREASPSKRSRAGDTHATPTPQPSGPTPRFNPPATSTSNMFAKAISDKPSTPSASTSLFMSQPVEKSNIEAPKPAVPAVGFTPSFPTSNGTSGSKPTSISTGFKPNFGSGSTGGGGGGFFSQFSKTAKTYEELAAERKAKVMAEDYDSDDETEEEWSARYDKEEAERLTAEKKLIAAAPTFSAPASTKSSDGTSPPSNPFASLTKPTSGASTPGLFNSRLGSPALSTGGHSVFDAPSNAQTPSSNIFGHLSSGPSSNNQDDSDEDDGEHAAESPQNGQPLGSVEPTTPPTRKTGDSEPESDETLEETMRRKKQETASKGSLLSRMTRADDDGGESEKENSNTSSIFGQTNGTQTPTNKPFQFFDFGAAGSGATTPKADTFAGDQTFKPGTPIKFGDAPATEKKSVPTFQWQPATPSAADFSTTPAKPPPAALFNFGSSIGGSSLLAPNAGFSGAPSVTSSVFSSRAGTPLSEADNSAASAGEDDEEGGKQAQVDFSQLTEEETNANDIVFHTEVVLAKHQVDKGDGTKTWANLAKGPLWILKDKVTAKCFVRIRISSGATPLDYRLLPALQATVTGSSKKMIMATKPAKEGGLQQVLYAVKTPEIAEEFATKYNESLPSK